MGTVFVKNHSEMVDVQDLTQLSEPKHHLQTNLPSSISDSRRVFLLTSLLPYNIYDKVRSSCAKKLSEYLILIDIAIESMNAWKSGLLSKFDALVGENACQIRAIKLALITTAKRSVDADGVLARLLQVKMTLQIASDRKMFIVNEFDLFFEVLLTYSEWFLIQTFILTHIKVILPPTTEQPLLSNEYTDAKKIRDFGPASATLVREMVKKLRALLARLSVNFIQELTSPKEDIYEMVSGDFIFYHGKLACIPCYWGSKILLQTSIKHSIPLIVHASQLAKDENYRVVEECMLYFIPTGTGYQLSDLPSINSESPAIVICGSSCDLFKNLPNRQTWINRLVHHDQADLFLAYAAVHRQYPDSTADSKFDTVLDPSYHYYKAMAGEWGCSMRNPTLFFQKHVFCDKIRNVI